MIKMQWSLVIRIGWSAMMAANTGMAVELRPDRFGATVELGAPLTNISVQHCVVGTEGRKPVAYYTVAGRPAVFHVVGLEDNRLLETHELPHAARSWGHVIAPDGTVYVGGVAQEGSTEESAHLYRYLPEEKRVEDLGPGLRGQKFIWALAAADDGRIYGGTWEGGHVFEYNPVTGKTTDLGRIDPSEDYVRSIAWHDGYVYAGTGARNGRVWRFDPDSGEKERIEIPVREEYADDFDRVRSAYHLAVAGDHLFAFFNGPQVMLVYDLEERRWWDQLYKVTSGPVTGVFSEEENVFYYAGRQDSLWAIDLETRTETKVMRYRGAFRGGSFVQIEGMPGKTLATVFANGAIGLLNPESRISRTLESRAEGQQTDIHALESGPGGAIYVSGYMGSSAAAFDPATRQTRVFPIGQAEGMVSLGDSLFYGVYPKARIYRQYPLSDDIQPRLLLDIGHRQDRPFAMISGKDRVFIGTIPDYGEHGGALTVLTLDAEGGIDSVVYPQVVAEQSIVGLAYHEDSERLFGSTSIHGGLGVAPKATAAKLFVWDVMAGKKVKEFSPPLSGVTSPGMIGGLSVGPDGLIWGAANGAVFALDPETLEVVKQRNIYPNVSSYGRWRPIYLRWGDDGLLYTNLAENLIVIDPATLEYLSLGEKSGLMALGSDGNVYFANGPLLKMIPAREQRGRGDGWGRRK